MIIYIVFGSTGEYSDHIEWILKAFTDKSAAEDLVANATVEAQEAIKKYPRYSIPKGANKYDPQMKVDYTGVNYYLVECELVDG